MGRTLPGKLGAAATDKGKVLHETIYQLLRTTIIFPNVSKSSVCRRRPTMSPAIGYGMGWRTDYPDFRDFTAEQEQVQPLYQRLGVTGRVAKGLPKTMDLRPYCTEVTDQGALGSCTAQAGVSMVEFFEKKAFKKHIDGSRLFLYKATRNLMHETGDTGGYIRTTMQALVLFGVPPEEYWPYIIDDFDKEPGAFLYAFAENYQAISYVRLDPPKTSPPDLLNKVKTNIAASLPCMFGFTVYSSIEQAGQTGRIPFPSPGDRLVGGHAVLAVGYDDNLKIKNNDSGLVTKGALMIQNSWGTSWGEKGFGWLPYDYILKGVAVDWWSLIKSEWVDSRQFGFSE
jgi:C1A family cysteine protease